MEENGSDVAMEDTDDCGKHDTADKFVSVVTRDVDGIKDIDGQVTGNSPANDFTSDTTLSLLDCGIVGGNDVTAEVGRTNDADWLNGRCRDL